MLATDAYNYALSQWVYGVSPTGTFIKNPEATWDVRGENGVPEGWTIKFDGEEEGGTYDEYFGQIPPESTSFEFPLYITVPFVATNTVGQRIYERQSDDIALQLRAWFFENADVYHEVFVEIYELRPDNIYMNGRKVTYMSCDIFIGDSIETVFVNIELDNNWRIGGQISSDGYINLYVTS